MSRSQSVLPIQGVPQVLGSYLVLQRKLGKGNNATVVEAKHFDLEVHVAIKIIDTSKVNDQYVLRHLAREAGLLRRLAHPNIIAAFESMRAGPLYCLVTELVDGGELCAHVSEQPDGHLDENTTRRFAGQLLSALAHMHDHGVVHRDLKMKNILLNQDRDGVKIIDFGLSNTWPPENPLRTHCGSPGYAAPEVYVLGKPYGPEVDMWSLGVILYGMAVGRLPFPTCQDQGVSAAERRARLITLINKGANRDHVEAMSHFSAPFGDLVTRLLRPTPPDRLTVRNAPDDVYRLSKYEHNEIVTHLALMLSTSVTALEAQCRSNKLSRTAAAYNILAHETLSKSYKAWVSQATSTIQSTIQRASSVERSVPRDQSSLHSSSKNVILSRVDSKPDLEKESTSQENFKLRFSQLTLTPEVPSKLTTKLSSVFPFSKTSSKPSDFSKPCSHHSNSPSISKSPTKGIKSNQPSEEYNRIVILSSESSNAEQTAQNHVKIGRRSSFMSKEKLHRSVQTSSSDLNACYRTINPIDSGAFQLKAVYSNNVTENFNIDVKSNKSTTWYELAENKQTSQVEMVRESVPQLTSKRKSSLLSKGNRGVQWTAEDEITSTGKELTFRQKSSGNRNCKAVPSSSAQSRTELFPKLKLVTEKKPQRSLLKSACPSQPNACSQSTKEVRSGNQSSCKNELNKRRQDTPTILSVTTKWMWH